MVRMSCMPRTTVLWRWLRSAPGSLRSGFAVCSIAAWAVLATQFCGASALAQTAAVSEERAQSFQAVTGAVKEDIAGGPLMLAAYAFVWVALFAYVFRLVRLHRALEQHLDRVEHAVGDAPSRQPR
jgi:CcmD family protein